MKTQNKHKRQNNKTLKHYIFKWSTHICHIIADGMSQQQTVTMSYWHDMSQQALVRCYNPTTYNASYHGMLQQQTLAMSQHMMSHAMKQHALCHVLWHNSIQCHSIIFWNKIQYVAACYVSVNSMSQRQALCHDMVCHINRHHIITWYATIMPVITTYVATTISMSLQHM